jgi:hypothetical protein
MMAQPSVCVHSGGTFSPTVIGAAFHAACHFADFSKKVGNYNRL